MHRRPAASLVRPLGLLLSVLLATFAGIGPSVLANDTPGNNGTVKVHEGPAEHANGEVREDSHVCTFHLHFYFADPQQAGTWEIQEWAPTGTKGTVVLTGTYDTAGDGEDRQPADGVYTLPDGHYKLFWDGDLDTNKHDKMKVFWVECVEASPSPVGSEVPIQSASVTPSQSASVTPSESAAPTGSELPIETGSVAPTESAAPTGSELPIETSSVAPTGSELPIAGSEQPTGGVEGATGVPGNGVTPPPTDTVPSAQRAGDDGWRVVVMGLAALIAAAMFLIPTRSTASVGNRSDRRGR